MQGSLLSMDLRDVPLQLKLFWALRLEDAQFEHSSISSATSLVTPSSGLVEVRSHVLVLVRARLSGYRKGYLAGYRLHTQHSMPQNLRERHPRPSQPLKLISSATAGCLKEMKAISAITYTSSIEPILGCIFLCNDRICRKARASCWRCTSSCVHPINLLHARHPILFLNCQWGDRAFHFQLQPGNGFASIRTTNGSSRRCHVRRLL